MCQGAVDHTKTTSYAQCPRLGLGRPAASVSTTTAGHRTHQSRKKGCSVTQHIVREKGSKLQIDTPCTWSSVSRVGGMGTLCEQHQHAAFTCIADLLCLHAACSAMAIFSDRRFGLLHASAPGQRRAFRAAPPQRPLPSATCCSARRFASSLGIPRLAEGTSKSHCFKISSLGQRASVSNSLQPGCK